MPANDTETDFDVVLRNFTTTLTSAQSLHNSTPGLRMLSATADEVEALKAVLSRDLTSRPSYEGLWGLLSLSHGEYLCLMEFLQRI